MFLRSGVSIAGGGEVGLGVGTIGVSEYVGANIDVVIE